MAQSQVLLLGGWSAGPLDWLRAQFASTCEFHEPLIPTPPAGCGWCVSPPIALLALWLVGVPGWILPLHALPILLRLILDCGVLVVLVSWTVRHSILRGVHIAEKAIREHNIDLIVGFSWGGGIGCWLLARGMEIPTLLLAPTPAAMAKFAMMRINCPMFKVRNKVAIFHAASDGFCPPSQIRELSQTGAEMNMCDDVHTLSDLRSLEDIGTTFSQLLRGSKLSSSSASSPT